MLFGHNYENFRLIVDKEPSANAKEVEVIVSPTGNFTPTDPLEVQNRTFSKMKKRDSMMMLKDKDESRASQLFGNIIVFDKLSKT